MNDLTILDILLEENVIDDAKYSELKTLNDRSQKYIFEILEDENIIKEEELIRLISRRINIPYINLNVSLIDRNIVNLIPEEIIRTNNVIPIFKIQNMLTVGMVDPTDLYLIDELKQITGLNISPVLVSQS